MKRYSILTAFICILAVSITSCDSVDFGDINEDDDAPQEANPEALMANAMNQYYGLAGRSYQLNPTLYVQYQTQDTYTTEMRYGQNPYPWTDYYSGVLSNLNEVYTSTIDAAGNPDLEAYGKAENQAAVANIFSAVVFKRVTDTWGPIPYRSADGETGEALNAENNKAPAYTDQETIYKDLISRVQNARDNIIPGAAGPTGDVLYGGDMENWQKFANSLILQMSLQLSEKYPSASGYAATQFNEALNHSAGVVDELSEEAWYNHENSPGQINPFTQSRGADYHLSEGFTDALQAKTPQDSAIVYSFNGDGLKSMDERIKVLSDDPSGTGVGGPYGTPGGGDGININDATIWTADGDMPYMTAAYTYLNRAEAASRGWTSENVDQMLRQGIMMSYATFDGRYDPGNENDASVQTPNPDFDSGALQSDGSDYATDRIADANDPNVAPGGYEQVIAEEKWVALFPNGFDAWAEWRRTSEKMSWGTSSEGYDIKGYPGLVPAPDATNGGIIPRRYIYPSTESGVNTGSYDNGVEMLDGDDDNYASFWWDPLYN